MTAIEAGPLAEEISFRKARRIIGLSKGTFRKFVEPYVADDKKSLEPISVLQVARDAYQAGESRRFCPSLNEVARDIIDHVRERTPDFEPTIREQVNGFFATCSTPEIQPEGIIAEAQQDNVPPHILARLERAYLGAPNS